MRGEKETSVYNNPALENYVCDGQITIEEWLMEQEIDINVE